MRIAARSWSVSITELLLLILPSLSAVLFLAVMLSFGLKGQVKIKKTKQDMNTVDYVIAGDEKQKLKIAVKKMSFRRLI